MSNQLVMYEEEVRQINQVADVLHRDSNAKAVLVIDKNGQPIAQAGETDQLDVTSLCSLIAGNVAAMGGIAQLLGEREFAGQTFEGERLSVLTNVVATRLILVVFFDERSSLGLVRLRVKKAGVELSAVIETVTKKAASGTQPSAFSEITDDDIDNLFND